MKEKRANLAFALIRQNMSDTLPVISSEYIDCWENLEWSILTLEKEQFEILWNSFVKSNKKYKEKIKQIDFRKPKTDQEIDTETIEQEIVQDKTIFEMERAFAEGNTADVLEMLNKFK